VEEGTSRSVADFDAIGGNKAMPEKDWMLRWSFLAGKSTIRFTRRCGHGRAANSEKNELVRAVLGSDHNFIYLLLKFYERSE
jgi:hypothetical protein